MAGWCDHQLQLRAEELAQPKAAAPEVPVQTTDELFWRYPETASADMLNFAIQREPAYLKRAKVIDIISTFN
jgi:hypothetical protein